MPSASVGTVLVLRLVRISTLVLGSLVFLHSCEVRTGLMAGSVRIELIAAAVLSVTGLSIAWFEINVVKKRGHQGFLVESEDCVVRAKIVKTGELVFRGHDLHAAQPDNEWAWTFAPDAFPAIRDALGGGQGELLDLLERTVPHLDPDGRRDPGAWLREHGIPANYRERGVSATRHTRELPIIDITLADDPPGQSRRAKTSLDNALSAPARVSRDLSAVLARMRAAVPLPERDPEPADNSPGAWPRTNSGRSHPAPEHEPADDDPELSQSHEPRARRSRAATVHDPAPADNDPELSRSHEPRARRSRAATVHDPAPTDNDPELSRSHELRAGPRARRSRAITEHDPEAADDYPQLYRDRGLRTDPRERRSRAGEQDPESPTRREPRSRRATRARSELEQLAYDPEPIADELDPPPGRQRPLRSRPRPDQEPIADLPLPRDSTARRRASGLSAARPEYDTAAPEPDEYPFEPSRLSRRAPARPQPERDRRAPVQGADDYLPRQRDNDQSPWPSSGRGPARAGSYRSEPEYDSAAADSELDAFESSRVSRRPPARRRAQRPAPVERGSAAAEPDDPWPRPDRGRETPRHPDADQFAARRPSTPPRSGLDRSAAPPTRRPYLDENYSPPTPHGPPLPTPPYAEPGPAPSSRHRFDAEPPFPEYLPQPEPPRRLPPPNPGRNGSAASRPVEYDPSARTNRRLPPPPDLAPPGRHSAASDSTTYSEWGGRPDSNGYWDD